MGDDLWLVRILFLDTFVDIVKHLDQIRHDKADYNQQCNNYQYHDYNPHPALPRNGIPDSLRPGRS